MIRVSRHSWAILLAFLLCGFLAGCPEGAQGPVGPILTGDLIGYSNLYDVYNNKEVSSSGITVTAEGSGVSAVSASDGRWVLSGLKTGTYTMAFSKAGYGTRKQQGYQFVGGGPTWWGNGTHLYRLPEYTVTGLTATPSGTDVIVRGTVTGTLPTTIRWVRVFIGTTAAVSSNPIDYVFSVPPGAPDTSTTFTTSISAQTLAANKFTSGQTAYFVAYAEAVTIASYLDLATNRYWYPNLNPTPSNVVSMVVP